MRLFNLGHGLLGALAGSVAGALAWIAAATSLTESTAWVALVVGLLSGVGMAIGSRKRAGPVGGAVAALIAGVACGVGGFARFAQTRPSGAVAVAELTNEQSIDLLSQQVVKSKIERGESVTLDAQGAVPQAIRLEATDRWLKLSEDDRKTFRRAMAAKRSGGSTEVQQGSLAAGFSAPDPNEMLWLGLGLMSAMGLGMIRSKKNTNETVNAQLGLTVTNPQAVGAQSIAIDATASAPARRPVQPAADDAPPDPNEEKPSLPAWMRAAQNETNEDPAEKVRRGLSEKAAKREQGGEQRKAA